MCLNKRRWVTGFVRERASPRPDHPLIMFHFPQRERDDTLVTKTKRKIRWIYQLFLLQTVTKSSGASSSSRSLLPSAVAPYRYFISPSPISILRPLLFRIPSSRTRPHDNLLFSLVFLRGESVFSLVPWVFLLYSLVFLFGLMS